MLKRFIKMILIHFLEEKSAGLKDTKSLIFSTSEPGYTPLNGNRIITVCAGSAPSSSTFKILSVEQK